MESLRTLLRSLWVHTPKASKSHTKMLPDLSGEAEEAEVYIQSILRIYGELSKRQDLRPCAAVNQLFGELVELCTTTLSETATKKITQDQRIVEISPSLRIICATAESHLESFWADQIAASKDVPAALKDFPYHGNYVDLTRMELSALYSIESSIPRKIAFIGSGPLPLTSLCLCMALNTDDTDSETSSSPFPFLSPTRSLAEPLVIANIDHSREAISQSQALCSNLGHNFRGMRFICEEAGNPDSDLSDFDVVYLAALVGMTTDEKEGILLDVVRRMKAGGLLVVRTAHSLRTLLYPEFDATAETVLACLDIEVVVHPYNHVVNSVMIGRVRARGNTSDADSLGTSG